MPEMRNPPARKPEGINTETTNHHHEIDGSSHGSGLVRHRRWRDAVRRMPRLDCGCRDICHCTKSFQDSGKSSMPPLSDHQLDGWADCARYVIDTTGCTPLLPIEVLRALYRRGGVDRALAEKIHAAAGGRIA